MDSDTTPLCTQSLTEILNPLARPEALSALVATGEIMIQNAVRGSGSPRCAWDSSGLTLTEPHRSQSPCTTLLIDIGGTHTKVAIARQENEFDFLLDEPNDSFHPTTPHNGLPLRAFLHSLLSRISETAPALLKDKTPVRIGVIWSNQITTRPLATPELSGITGLVCGLHAGGYRKGEWFLDGLRDGDDIGQEFRQALVASGINTDVLVIGNDTIFTLFARPNSHAGVVVSSGANCTLVGSGVSGELTIYNSELGGTLLVPDSMLSEGDRIFRDTRKANLIAIEELCGGAWFKELCVSHIEAFSALSEGAALLPIQDAISKGTLSFSNATLSALLRKRDPVPAEFRSFEPSSVEALTALVGSLVNRAGAFAAVLAYLSVSSQVKQGNRAPNISLDSSMARHFVGYYRAIEDNLKSLMPHDVTFSLHLVEPIKLPGGAEITVPMVGLARALREYQKPAPMEHADDTPQRSE